MEFIFIEPETASPAMEERQPASYIRKSVHIRGGLISARLYMTALGVYKPYFNGHSPDDQMLLPGFTDYHRRVQYQEYDVTSLVRAGENVIGCILGDGWYRGCLGAFNKRNVYGEKTKFACILLLSYPDREETICTGEDWKATQNGALRENDLKQSEVYDARMELQDWCAPGYDDQGWHGCVLSEYSGDVVPSEGEKLLPQDRFIPKILYTPDGNTVLDFGQNIAGIVEFTISGPPGTEVSLTMGETLDEKGNFTLKNLEGEGRAAKAMGLGQKLTYILKDGVQTYRPHFLLCGFRYVKLENWTEPVLPENFTSIAVYSALEQTGTFHCSNPLIDRFVHNVLWSERSNFVDIPTDCPQRERAGWTGDINVFIETANYLTDTRKFISKWMQDFIGMQEEDGSIPVIIPEVSMVGVGKSSAGWSDAIASLPMAQYLCYGETADMEAAYDTIRRYVEYNRRLADKRHPLHIHKRGAHRKYIVDVGFHFGEWLEPGSSNLKDGLKAMLCPDSEVATAWFFYTTLMLSRIAKVLGKDEDASEYRCLSGKIREAYRREFLKGGKVHSKRQCKYVRPVYMGLADKDECAGIIRDLNELCISNGYRIGTGFLTTYQVLNVLTDYGYADTAYRMMENEDCPGWLYEVKQGATTVWEGWDAVKDGELNPLSQNHYAPGAAAAWLFSRCAGIRPKKPGYREIEIHPIPGGTLTFADAEYKSPAGTICSKWKIEGGQFVLNVTLPENIPATVVLPDGSRYENAVSGTYSCRI